MIGLDRRSDPTAQLHAGREALRCDRCGATVLVSKNSLRHTSIQWSAQAVGACQEFAAATGEPNALVPTCSTLRGCVERAVREGRLAVSAPVEPAPDVEPHHVEPDHVKR